jgi:hypothetical protein
LINKGLRCLPEKISSWQENKFGFSDWIRQSNPQVFPQESAGRSYGSLDWRTTVPKRLKKIA